MLRRHLIVLVLFTFLAAPAAASPALAQSNDFQRGVSAYAAGDTDAALDHWRIAAEADHAGAAFLLANLYASGEAGSVQHHLAFRYYHQAAEAGHGEAQIALSNYYRHGNRAAGVEADLQKTHEWLVKAAEARNAHAQYILGDMHTRGEGVEKNPHRGMRWFLLAADKRYALALARLAWVYAEGEIVTADPGLGFMYMSLAVEEAQGRERTAIKAQYDRMLTIIAPQERQRGLELAAQWRAERQALWQ